MPSRDRRIRRTKLESILFGELSLDNPARAQRELYKVTPYAKVIAPKAKIVLVMGAMISYFLIVVCGTMGSPTPIKVDAANCGLYNNCTIASQEGYDTSGFLLWRPGI